MNNAKFVLCIISLFLIFGLSERVWGQYQKVDGAKTCGTIEGYPEGHPNYLKHKNKLKDQNKRIKDFIENPSREVNNGIITIPVVFHIIHEGSPIGVNENLAVSQVQDQLDQLNDDFRRMNSDANNTLTVFGGLAVDTEIEFCLVDYDPVGYPSSGITRHLAYDFSFITPTSGCISRSRFESWIKPETSWDRDRYLNVWVAPSLCGLYGYAQFPDDGDADTDGVVVHHSTVGSLEFPNLTATDAINKGRTLTHEVGHFLNLYHTFSGGCSGSDFVGDTPSVDVPNRGCDLTHVSCGTLDMVQNYMDYADDDCMNLFTFGQKFRAIAALQLFRPELMNATCGPPVRENDLCSQATIAYACNTYLGNTLGATNSGAGPVCSPGVSPSPGVWYILPTDGSEYTLSTCESATFDTVIDVYTGSCGSLTCYASNDQACPGGTSEVTFSTTAGQSYYVYVSGYFTGSAGLFELSIYKNRPVTSRFNSGPGSLRDAVECAPSGAVITIDSSLDGLPFNLTGETILIERDITIQGTSYASILIDGSGNTNSIFRSTADNLTLKNLKFIHGGGEENIFGGALRSSSNTNIINCVFEYNGSKEDGGAINVVTDGTFNLINSQLRQNEAFGNFGCGGAVWTNARYINFHNNLIVNNAAGYFGGAVFLRSSPLSEISLINNTIANNVVTNKGGGLSCDGDIEEFYSNIIAGNNSGNEGPDVYLYPNSTVMSSANNLIEDPTDAGFTNGYITGDPLFVNTPFGDYSLQPGSSCTDTGSNSNIPNDALDIDLDGNTTETLPVDVLGNLRVLNQTVDMGAIERIPGACVIDALYDLYTYTNGDSWIDNSDWLSACNPCMGGSSTWKGIVCNAADEIIEINLSNNNLDGTLPSSLEYLPSLEKLNLSDNSIAGVIPSQFGNLSNLVDLSLNSNSLTGTIPSQLGSLSNLSRLGLAGNQLMGSIPSSLGNLNNLNFLYLHQNQLSEPIPPSLSSLQNIIQILMYENQLTGTIPDFTTQNNLTILDLHDNMLSGIIPSVFPTSMIKLILHQNNFTGSIPATIGSLPILSSLNLSSNNLSGCYPSSLSNLCNILVYLNNNPQLPAAGDFTQSCPPNNFFGECDSNYECDGNYTTENGSPMPNVVLKMEEYILSAGTVDIDVTFQARDSIVLKHYFEVLPGAVFEVILEDCSQ